MVVKEQFYQRNPKDLKTSHPVSPQGISRDILMYSHQQLPHLHAIINMQGLDTLCTGVMFHL